MLRNDRKVAFDTNVEFILTDEEGRENFLSDNLPLALRERLSGELTVKQRTKEAEKSPVLYPGLSSSGKLAGSGNVEIPAGKTVAVLLYTSSYLHSRTKVSEGAFSGDVYTYGQFIQWGIHNIRNNFLTAGLEIDVERTLKACQCPGLSETYELWSKMESSQIGATVVVIRVENADQEEEITANVIGGVDEETGEYQGIQAFLSSESIVHVAPRHYYQLLTQLSRSRNQ
ncbi:putative phage related protein [Nephila pilipes]|uniref:Putative phage related protein n=1 Tax=Nephila pilipes TaxID=299642 RepID=A0A8X6UDM2_NEPPI|nr:putative phage related protein [Nephila pilipes]